MLICTFSVLLLRFPCPHRQQIPNPDSDPIPNHFRTQTSYRLELMRQIYNVESPPSSMLFDTSGMEALSGWIAPPSHDPHPGQQPQLLPVEPPVESERGRLTLANLIPSRCALTAGFICI